MRVVAALLLLLLAGPSFSKVEGEKSEPDVRIRVYFEPEGEIFVGQLVRLWVEVTTSTWFTQAPRYPDLQTEGAIVFLPEQLGVNFTDREGGETRTGQRQRYAIIPQRSGTFVIPPLTIKLGVSIDGKPSPFITVKSKSIKLSAIFPPGAEGLDQIIAIDKISVSETYDRTPKDLNVGDAITRTVTLRGEDTFALALPKVAFKPVAGTRIYMAQPQLNNAVNRGQYRATRSDAATYVLEQEGEVSLPEISVRWWNLESESIENTVLPNVRFTVTANSDLKPGSGPAADTKGVVERLNGWVAVVLAWLQANVVWFTLTAIGLYLFSLVWRRFQDVAVEKWNAWQSRKRESESRYFREFRRACRSGDRDHIVQSFWRWLDRLAPANEAAVLDKFARAAGDSAFIEYVDDSTKGRYGASLTDKGAVSEIYRRVARFRGRLLARSKGQSGHGERTLNPRTPAGNS